jgi:GNAT superfamily N-acetyltransferase
VSIEIRRATPQDAPVVATISRRSREAAMPWLPDLHTPAQDVAFFESELISRDAWVAASDEGVVAFAVTGEGWLHHLYVEVASQGLGIGSSLLTTVQQNCPDGLQLWVFEGNLRARAFYADRGFVEVERTDGSGNEEKEPDVRMQWRGQPPISARTA